MVLFNNDDEALVPSTVGVPMGPLEYSAAADGGGKKQCHNCNEMNDASNAFCIECYYDF